MKFGGGGHMFLLKFSLAFGVNNSSAMMYLASVLDRSRSA